MSDICTHSNSMLLFGLLYLGIYTNPTDYHNMKIIIIVILSSKNLSSDAFAMYHSLSMEWLLVISLLGPPKRWSYTEMAYNSIHYEIFSCANRIHPDFAKGLVIVPLTSFNRPRRQKDAQALSPWDIVFKFSRRWFKPEMEFTEQNLDQCVIAVVRSCRMH